MLVARIEGSISGLDVTLKSPDHLPDLVTKEGTREVDVSLRSKVGSAEVLVIIECRDRGRPADVTWLEQVKSKREAVGAQKAIAVASGDFSKRALAAAAAYGIDARTLAQVTSPQIKEWAGALQVFSQGLRCDHTRVTVHVKGQQPLPEEVKARFDELVKVNSFSAKFILYPEGLLSPLDVLRDKIKEPLQASTAGKVQITLPPKSGILRLGAWLELRQRTERQTTVVTRFGLRKARHFSL